MFFRLTLSRIVSRVNLEFSIPLRHHLYKADLGHVWNQLISTNVVLPEGLGGGIIKKINELIEVLCIAIYKD